MEINKDNILEQLPSSKFVKISYMVKALGIRDIKDARFLQIKLEELVKSRLIEKKKSEGKTWYKKK
ncbi:MAG: hypothetical protein ACFFCS_18710 [Candidatus Hodarchaeota archaeon]